jgi:S-formylglutathione hydrolase FrmB
MTLSRRQFLLAGGVGAVALGAGTLGLVERGVLPGRTRLHTATGACGTVTDPPADGAGPMVDGSFRSAARGGRDVGWTVAYPPGSQQDASLPVCLALPGRGGDHTSAFTALGVQHHLAAAVAAGARPFAIASVDGGDASYWHRRADGDDPARMVTDELLPLLESRNLRAGPSDRIGFIGWSMGGYGSLLFAETLTASRVAVVVAASPALWHTGAESAAGAFDDAADFDAHNVFNGRSKLEGIALRVDCGDADPFAAAVRDFVTELPASTTATPTSSSFEPGCHDDAYWMRMLPAQTRFLADHLPA